MLDVGPLNRMNTTAQNEEGCLIMAETPLLPRKSSKRRDGNAAARMRRFMSRSSTSYGRAYATGKRKDAVARVWIKPGSGKITVNGKSLRDLFRASRAAHDPAAAARRDTARVGQYDLLVNVVGGGLSGQAGAVRHGLSKALTYFEPDLRPILKKEGFLTRDSRVVERKKYGKKKARRSFQFSKR